MPENASMRSAVKPAGPVTCAATPSGASCASRSATASTVVLTLIEVSIGTKASAAFPSFEEISGETPLSTPGRPLRPSTAVRSCCSCESLSFASDENTTTAGIACESVKSPSMPCTFVASADDGR